MADSSKSSMITPMSGNDWVFCKIRRVLPPRFFAKVVVSESGCWIWQGSRCHVPGFPQHSYGQLRGWNKARSMAHRFAYETVIGPIPKGLEIDHLCNTKLCVNPTHLEAVNHAENIRRRPRPVNRVVPFFVKTQCIRGHLFTEQNTYVPADGHRRCRACNAIRQRRLRKSGGLS